MQEGSQGKSSAHGAMLPDVEDKERKRLQRKQATAAGKCIICCKRKARAGKTTCKKCYERNKAALYRRRKAQGT
jgi:hypothetical protein